MASGVGKLMTNRQALAPIRPMRSNQPKAEQADHSPFKTNECGAPDSVAAPKNRKRAAGVTLTVVARHLRQNFDQSADRSGLTRAKWTLIAAVAQTPGATQRIIAEAL